MEQTNKRAKYKNNYKCVSYINLSLVGVGVQRRRRSNHI
jgi:hypothetical protein